MALRLKGSRKSRVPLSEGAKQFIRSPEPHPLAPENPLPCELVSAVGKASRPKKGEGWASCISRILDESDVSGQPRRERLLRLVAQLAERGAPWAIQFLAEREEGKAPQALAISLEQRNPLAGWSDEELAALKTQIQNGGGPAHV